MTITKMAVAIGMVATAPAATVVPASPAQQNLVVYVSDKAGVPSSIRIPAEALAAKMFATIGIRLEWRRGEPVNPPSDTRYVAVALTTGTPTHGISHALAYAAPYEGVHITVFYDRIQKDFAPAKVLAHVMVHEITHLLQGVCRHSETGVMKAHWKLEDFYEMCYKPLPFAREDVELIYAGLARTSGKDKLVAGDF